MKKLIDVLIYTVAVLLIVCIIAWMMWNDPRLVSEADKRDVREWVTNYLK